MTSRCPECGTSLDEIPFVPCQTHRRHEVSQRPLTQEEIDQALDYELARILYERTGDD
jgi:hypothetical protein